MIRTMLAGPAILAVAGTLCACQPASSSKPAADPGKIAEAIKADVSQTVADFNAHDASKWRTHDAPDTIAMFHGSPNVIGAEADEAGMKKVLADPAAKVVFTDGVVDVAAAGDLAVYRGAYAYTYTDSKTRKLMTERGNTVFGYKPQPDGSWRIAWSVISDTGPATPA